MTIDAWLAHATTTLQGAAIATARLDALVLLEDATGKDRAWLLAHQETKLESWKVGKLESMLERRAAQEPLAYIRGKSEFFGRTFAVNTHTLEPRPETETMIELLLDLAKDKKLQIKHLIDVGTGSGCIAITAALELPFTKVYATDIDKNCLKIARQNAQNLGADVHFHHGNLLQPLPSTIYQLPTAILANLPYVPENLTINQAAQHEPKHAIFGGADGLDPYRQLFVQLQSKEQGVRGKWVLTESLPFQHDALIEIAASAGYSLVTMNDFIQVFELRD